jgi:hypothetical protein
MAGVTPNEYVLTGGGLTVTYITSNFLGKPFLSYKDNSGTKTFYDTAIRVVDVGIGTLVTVTTHMTIDTGGTEFSVLLPVIELPGIGKSQAFSTDGIITHFKGPDSFPATGVRETYDFVPMNGTARRVLFALEKAQAAKSA